VIQDAVHGASRGFPVKGVSLSLTPRAFADANASTIAARRPRTRNEWGARVRIDSHGQCNPPTLQQGRLWGRLPPVEPPAAENAAEGVSTIEN